MIRIDNNFCGNFLNLRNKKPKVSFYLLEFTHFSITSLLFMDHVLVYTHINVTKICIFPDRRLYDY